MANTEMDIIKIDKDNIYQIEPLWKELNDLHCEISSNFKEHYASFTFEQRTKDIFSREGMVIYAAQSDKDLVGYCISTKSGSVGEIDSLFVKHQFRGENLGVRLIEKAMAWLESAGCETIKLMVAEGNESVLAFYQKLGFQRRSYVLQLPKP